MDPTVCYDQINQALAEGDLEEAHYRAECLREWLEKGGFVPDQLKHLTRESALVAVTLMGAALYA